MSSKDKWVQKMKELHGQDFFRKIGQMGAQATKDAAKQRPEEFKERGAKGGATTLRRHGTNHYKQIVTERHARNKQEQSDDGC